MGGGSLAAFEIGLMAGPLLEARQVAFSYPQDGRGLAPTDLQVFPGQAVHIGGASGCGKSTLARCISGMIPHLYNGHLEGELLLAGQRTDQIPLWQISERAGMVFQNPASQMLAPTVSEEIIFGLENLGLDAAEIDLRLHSALEHFDLFPLRLRSPQEISGGEQQKVALAAISARQPPLMVLDEPLSMLDTTAACEFLRYLRDLIASGSAAVVCEHRHEYLVSLPGLRTLELSAPAPRSSAFLGESSPIDLPLASLSDCSLHARGLSVERGDRLVLNHLDFDLHGGQVAAIVGRNGVGKTTLLRALAALQSYDGELRLRLDGRDQAPQLGLVFQNPDLQLFNASVRQEILFRIPDPDILLYGALLGALDLKRYEETPPLLLSEGEKRRLALATVLMRQPAHGVLLDEPALGQDENHKRMLDSLLHALAATGRIVVYATHDIELAARADRLLLLGSEGLVASGPPAQVLQDNAAWDRLGLHLPEWLPS